MINPIEELDHFLYWGAQNPVAFGLVMLVVGPLMIYVIFRGIIKLDDIAESWHPHIHRLFGRHEVSNMDKGERIRTVLKESK